MVVNVTKLSFNAPAKATRKMFVHVHVRVGNCEIAVPIDEVRQALPFSKEGLAVLPRRTGALVGVADFSGSAVPIVDLGKWVSLGVGHDTATAQRLLVLQHAGAVVGVCVDAVFGVKTVGLDAIQKLHHQPDDAELFEAVVPASANGPVLCILEVARLMQLSNAWCEQAQLTPATASVAFASERHGQNPATKTQRFAVFRTGSERWAISVIAVNRVVPVPATELVLGRNGRSWAISQWQGRKLALVDISEGRQASDRQAAPWMVLLGHGGLLLGLTVSECLQFLDLPPEAMVDIPNDPLLAGVALQPDGGKLKVLDVARLFALTPEASISRTVPLQSGPQDVTSHADATEPMPYLVFDAGQRYASPVEGVLGVVELSSEAKADLLSGRPSFLVWRGQTIRLLNLPAISKSVEYADPSLAVIVQAPGDMVRPIGIAIRGLADWLPARSVRRSGMRMGAIGEFGLINAKGAEDHANLVVMDLAQMAYMLA